MAQALRGLAETHKARGSLPNAKTCLEKSIAAFEKGGALGHLDYGAAVASIADVISQQGDDAKADKLFVRAIMIMSANTVSTTLREEEQQVPLQEELPQAVSCRPFDHPPNVVIQLLSTRRRFLVCPIEKIYDLRQVEDLAPEPMFYV